MLARDPDDKKIITKIRLDEISLVDRPSNPESKFDLWRAAGLADGRSSFDRKLDGIYADLSKAEGALAKLEDSYARMQSWVGSEGLKKDIAGVALMAKEQLKAIQTFNIPPTSFTTFRDDAGETVVNFE